MKQHSSRALTPLLVLLALALASCVSHGRPRVAFASTDVGEEGSEATTAPVAGAGRVVLVTIDGVRAEDVFNGADPALRPGSKVEHLMRAEDVMPRTWKLVESRGVALGADLPGCGKVHTASGANVSLPGYLEIFSGRRSVCRDNACARTEHDTVLDEASAAGLGTASVGSWEILDHAVSRGGAGVFVAEGTQPWPGARPLAGSLESLVTEGERAQPYPGVGRYRPDVYTTSIALEMMRTAAPDVFHVGLGDPDEWGHRDDYVSYLRAIRNADTFIGELADLLDGMGDAGARTTVIVTTDHGRNSDFRHHGPASESAARTFVMAFGARVPKRGIACPAHDVTLADIAPTIRALVGLAADPGPDAGRPITEIAPVPALARRSALHPYLAGTDGSGAAGLQRP